MFISLAPQKVQHDSGYIVESEGRYSIKYTDDDFEAELKSELLVNSTVIYPETLSIRKKGKGFIVPTPEQKKEILGRIKLGIEVLSGGESVIEK